MTALIVLAHYIAKRSSFYKDLVTPKHDTFEPEREVNKSLKNRHEMLDGLRGFLALGVLFQHAMTNYTYFNTGMWAITEIKFYRYAGGEAVILFFLITSFLYWSKAIHERGKISLKKIYTNRFLRLAPMYLFSAFLVTLSILVQTRFNIYSWPTFLKDLLSWMSLGLVTTTSVDSISVIPINAGIHWTLHYEWIFYLLLPFTALMLRGRTWIFLAIPTVFLAFSVRDWGYWVIFIFGMIIAHVVHKWPKMEWLRTNRLAVWIPIVSMIAVYMYQNKPYSVPQYALSALILLCFIYGNSLFGLLSSKAARFLGTISYSVYLMHGIILFATLNLAQTVIPIAGMGPWQYWSLILIAGILTVLASTITYKYIEHPFLIKKKK